MTVGVKKCWFLAFIAMADSGTLLTSRMATADLELPHCSKTPKNFTLPHAIGCVYATSIW